MLKIYNKYVCTISSLTDKGVFVNIKLDTKEYKGLIPNNSLLNEGKYKEQLYFKDKEILAKLVGIKNLNDRKLLTLKEVFPAFEFFVKDEIYEGQVIDELEFTYIVAILGWTFSIKKRRFESEGYYVNLNDKFKLQYVCENRFDIIEKLLKLRAN